MEKGRDGKEGGQTDETVGRPLLLATKLILAKGVFMHTLGVAFGSTLITVLRAKPKAGDDVLN
jgi:hypothetical protein